jgi:hypothetical protein
MDEPGGFTAADAGPNRWNARVGGDSGTDFGRFRGARAFKPSIESFLYVPYNPGMEVDRALSVELWIEPRSWGIGEMTPIVGRWSPQPNEQSWIFGIVGLNLPGTSAESTSPGSLQPLVDLGTPGRLVFAVRPSDASLPISFFSNSEVELDRWTHVAVTYDGETVRFYFDGRLESQYALTARIRPSTAPILIGNFFDSRWLIDLGDRPRVGPGAERTIAYAFEGLMDEMRLSEVARDRFWPGR